MNQLTSADVKRFWSKVKRGAACWEWQAGKSGGYGYFSVGGRRGRMIQAHRISYELSRGEIPAGREIDHLCRNRACVNPEHLDLVTSPENTRRAMGHRVYLRPPRCKHGHLFDEANTYWWGGMRQCRACKAAHAVRKREERRRS